MHTEEEVFEVLAENHWPTGFASYITKSKARVAFRYVIVDNSRSMSKCDGRRLIEDRFGEPA
jgi:hypothetical protein